MLYKKIIFAAFAVFVLFGITGCGQNGASTAESNVPQATDGSYSGGKQAEDVNLKSIDVKTEGDDTIVSLSFVKGSRNSGEGDESSIDYTPTYKAYLQADHARFVVEIPDLQWWDFERDTQYTTESLANTKLKGMFGLATYNERPYQLYLQLDADSIVTVNEKANTITLRFSPKQTDSKEKYYVVANSFYEYKDGNITQSYELTPTLCSDLNHKVLISKAFDSQSDAQALKTKILNELGVIINDEDIKVVKLKTEVLPTFDFTKDEMAIYDVAVLAKVGSAQKQKVEVTIPGGYYVAKSPDATQLLYKKRVDVEDKSSQSSGQLEELWLINDTTNTKEKIGDEYNGIYSAKYSSDGSKVAFLDIDLDSDFSSSELYVYNFSTKELRNLSEEGLGNVTTYVWGDSNTLYTVSQLGLSETAQLLKCDLTKSSEDMVSSIKDQQVTPNYDGGLVYANGKLYLRDIDAATEEFIIYEIDPSGADWVKIASGVAFDVSADGKYMFVESYVADTQAEGDNVSDNYSDNEVPLTDITIIDLSNKQTKKIVSSKSVYKAGWIDNDNLFYVVNQDSAEATFPYILKTINKDGNSTSDVCQLSGYNIQPTGVQDTYYLMDSKEITDGQLKYVTYTIKKEDLDK